MQFFAQGSDLLAEGFELACIAYQHRELDGDCLFGKVRIDLFDNLIVIIPDPGELPVKIIQASDIPCSGRVAFKDAEFSSEESGEDEMRYVAGASGLFKHLPEAGILLTCELEIVPVNLGIDLFGSSRFSVCHCIFLFFGSTTSE